MNELYTLCHIPLYLHKKIKELKMLKKKRRKKSCFNLKIEYSLTSTLAALCIRPLKHFIFITVVTAETYLLNSFSYKVFDVKLISISHTKAGHGTFSTSKAESIRKVFEMFKNISECAQNVLVRPTYSFKPYVLSPFIDTFKLK